MSSSNSESVEAQREHDLYFAKVAEQAERYDEMAKYMKCVAETGFELSVDERNLLSVAYKNAVGSRRASWRIMSSVEQREKAKGAPEKEKMAREYKKEIEGELHTICSDILVLLDKHLYPAATQPESKVFFYKMMGDYHRYISEFQEETKGAAAQRAQEAYENATSIATKELQPTHPIRLGLALNFSVFHYEIMANPSVACGMAQAAFDEAIGELDNCDEDSYKDSTLIMQLLRDNLTLWTADEAGKGASKDEGDN